MARRSARFASLSIASPIFCSRSLPSLLYLCIHIFASNLLQSFLPHMLIPFCCFFQKRKILIASRLNHLRCHDDDMISAQFPCLAFAFAFAASRTTNLKLHSFTLIMSPMVPLPISFVRFMPVHVHLTVRCQAHQNFMYVRLESSHALRFSLHV
jgi:hypothetical protein